MRLKFTEDVGERHKNFVDFKRKDRIISSNNIRTDENDGVFLKGKITVVFCLFGNDGGDSYENTRLLQWKIW